MAKIKGKTKEEKQAELKELVNTMNNRIDDVTRSPEDLKEYMKFMSSFYKYSLRNTLLIQSQFPGANAVASFVDFKKMGFSPLKGEKGIKILVPIKPKVFIAEDGKTKKLSEATPEEKEKIKNKQIKVFEQSAKAYTTGHVFDISQTNAKAEDLPKIFPNRWLEGEVKDYDSLEKGINEYMKKIGVRERVDSNFELGASKGAYFPSLHEIILNPRNGQLQNIKTKIHELAHATLHRNVNMTAPEMEFQAELTAVSVCSYFGLDTTEYSLPYLHNWTKNAKLEDKKALLNGVHQTVKDMVGTIENTLVNSKGRKNELENEKMNDSVKDSSRITIPVKEKKSKSKSKSIEYSR